MKKNFLLLALVAFSSMATIQVNAQTTSQNVQKPQTRFKVVTTIESIVPMGIGRSRIIENDAPSLNYENLKSQDKVHRKSLKIDNYSSTKMLNFYSGTGINFQNIASNDAMISSMLNELTAQGWQLFNIVSGVESDAGKGDGKGIFITRYYFKK